MSQTQRIIARYLQAEILDKSWLMGVRRGWLSVMSPTIQDWNDVLQAFRNLNKFVVNLSEQVFYVRRGPHSGSVFMEDGQKILVLLKQLSETIGDARSRAQHWESVAKGTSLPGSRVEDAAQMLALYRSDFAEATSYSQERGKGRWDKATLTDLFDKILKILREDAQRLKDHNESHPDDSYDPKEAYKEFDLYGMKVIIDDATVLPGDIHDYIKILDTAYHLLQKKGFAKAWYGTVFVQCHSCGGTNSNGADFGVGGDYHITKDTVRVYSRPSAGVIHLVAHELGHRYWFKQMSGTQRGKFESLVKVHKSKRPTYTPDLFTSADVQAAHKMVDEAMAPVRTVLKDFGQAQASWWRDSFDKYRDTLYSVGWNAWAPHLLTNTDTPEVKGLLEDAKKARKELTDFLQNVDSIVDVVHSTPELKAAPKNLDAYWWKIFESAREAWIVEAEQKLEAAVATAYICINAAEAQNRAEKARAEKYMQDWNEEFKKDERKVLPVSGYGESNIDEAFAEVFADYVLGKDLTRDQLESFKEVALKTAERVALRYLSAGTLELNLKWVEKLRKDFLLLLKGLGIVRTKYSEDAEIFQEFRSVVRNFRKEFNDVLFDKLLNKSLKWQSEMSETDTKSFDRMLRKPGWDLYIALELDQIRSLSDLDTWERRVRKAAQEFWKAAKNAFEWYERRVDQKGVSVDTPDRLVIEGFQLEMVGYDASKDYNVNGLERLKEALKVYRRSASKTVPWLIQHQLPLIVNFQSGLDEGGRYHSQGYIDVNPLAGSSNNVGYLVQILAHEMGHHLFKYLGGHAEKFWDSAIRQDYGPLDIEKLLQKWGPATKHTYNMVEELMTKDPILALQLDVLSYGHESKAYDSREDFEEALASGIRTLPVPQTPITGYAGKNPEESFCEAIGLLVGFGPMAVHPLIRHWLEMAIPGLVKLGSEMRVAIRFSLKNL